MTTDTIIRPCHECGREIPKDKKKTAKFCSRGCKNLDRAKTRRDKSKNKKHKCAVCESIYERESNAQKYCLECRKKGTYYNAQTGEFTAYRWAGTISHKFYKDFRTTICLKNHIQCANFSACSDSVIEHKNGLFEYQKNGGVDCYVPPAPTRYTAKGGSFALHLERF